MLGSEEDLHHEDRSANYDRAVGDVEVWPDVRTDVELEEVNYMSGEDAVPKVSKRSATREPRQPRALEEKRRSGKQFATRRVNPRTVQTQRHRW